ICNSIDDDCNGKVDDGDLCPPGLTCFAGACGGAPDASVDGSADSLVDAKTDGSKIDSGAGSDTAVVTDGGGGDAKTDAKTDAKADAKADASAGDASFDDADAGDEQPNENADCACRTTGSSSTPSGLYLVALAAAFGLARRRRRALGR
ncbi:MAG: MYXO-CTERM sorting domain-containing protein, partial [Polyangiales bacterium]